MTRKCFRRNGGWGLLSAAVTFHSLDHLPPRATPAATSSFLPTLFLFLPMAGVVLAPVLKLADFSFIDALQKPRASSGKDTVRFEMTPWPRQRVSVEGKQRAGLGWRKHTSGRKTTCGKGILHGAAAATGATGRNGTRSKTMEWQGGFGKKTSKGKKQWTSKSEKKCLNGFWT